MQITNIRQLRESLVDNYEKTKDKKMPLNMCKELTNAAGKIINTVQLELLQNQLLKEAKIIDFLSYEKETYKFDKGIPKFDNVIENVK